MLLAIDIADVHSFGRISLDTWPWNAEGSFRVQFEDIVTTTEKLQSGTVKECVHYKSQVEDFRRSLRWATQIIKAEGQISLIKTLLSFTWKSKVG
jgi:hypothetical protein